MLREVAVKTLTGRGKIPYIEEKSVVLSDINISKILGCWIINLNYDIRYEGNKVFIDGFYSMQIWYAYDQDKSTSVYEEKVLFTQEAMMVYRNDAILTDEKTIKVYVNKYPSCIDMKLDNNTIYLKIEGLFYIDVFQEAILVIECNENKKWAQ